MHLNHSRVFFVFFFVNFYCGLNIFALLLPSLFFVRPHRFPLQNLKLLQSELRRRQRIHKAEQPKESPDVGDTQPEANTVDTRAHSPLPLSHLSQDAPAANYLKYSR
jgi:hypothetical protein